MYLWTSISAVRFKRLSLSCLLNTPQTQAKTSENYVPEYLLTNKEKNCHMLELSFTESLRECTFKVEIFINMASVRKFFVIIISLENHASIYEGEFADESFHLKHTEIGLIGMTKRKAYSHSNEC